MKTDSPLTEKQTVYMSLCLILIVWLSLFLVRLSAPSDLLDNDQERPAAYMLDAAVNGNWIIQLDDRGDVCSKPPIYTWLGALLILVCGEINHFTLLFPSALAVLGCCGLIWLYGRRYFGLTAAFLASLVYVASPAGNKMIFLARTDSLFTFMVTLCAMMAFSAWTRGRGWIWFWLAATAATLTKGPLGVVLAAGGLWAHIWEKRTSSELRFRGNFWLGGVLFLAVAGGWLALAYWQMGQPVLDKLLGRELLGHANWAGKQKSILKTCFLPTLYFISRFAPWSILAGMGIWKAWKQPAPDPEQRRFERFLCCLIVAGILVFSLFPHQRGDLIFPLLPAAAILAGRELASLFHVSLTPLFLRRIGILWVVVLLSLTCYYHFVRGRQQVVLETTAVRQVARQVQERFGKEPPIVYADAPFGLQFYLGTIQRRVSLQEAAERLTRNEPVLVAVQHLEKLKKLVPTGTEIYDMTSWPGPGEAVVTVVSNEPNGIERQGGK